MAKAYRLTPKRRVALRKAQIASARKRRGHGKKVVRRPNTLKTHAPKMANRNNMRTAAVVANRSPRQRIARKTAQTKKQLQRNNRIKVAAAATVGVVAVGVAAHKVYYHANYVTGYHRTGDQAADSIIKSKEWVSKTHARNYGMGVEGSDQGIWFSKYRVFGTNKQFGPNVLKVKYIPKQAVQSHRSVMIEHARKHGIATHNGVPHQRDWFMVDAKYLSGKKVRRAGTVRGLRRRAIRQKIYDITSQPGREHMSYLVSQWN